VPAADAAWYFPGMDASSPVPPPPQPGGPGPRGPLRTALVQLQFLLDPLDTVARRFARFGDAYRVRQEDSWLYVFRHPDHIRDVLVTNAAAFDKQHGAFQRLSLVLGDALLTSDGERWRRQRRLVQPAFARPRLSEYGAVMVEEAARSSERLAQGGTFDVSREMNRLTLRIVTRTLFGQALDDSAQSGAAMLELNRWFATPGLVMRLIPGAQQRFERAQATLDGVIDGLIEAKRRSLARSESAPGDLLSALMSARDDDGAALTARELRDQLLTLYIAGHETTSHALTWTLYLLSQNPNARAELHAEHARVLGGRLPTFDDLPALPYTEQVFKEALRLYPPAFVVPRRACADTFVGEYAVAKGSEVVLWSYHTQRDGRFYPQPDAFRPERFAGAEDALRPKYAYLPFGAGQRACIGQMFAMNEAQLILATLLPRLRFEYIGKHPARPRTGVTLAPRGGMPMRIGRSGMPLRS
jgi:cytochrome P450